MNIYWNLSQLCDFWKFFLTLCFIFPEVLEIFLVSSVHFRSTQTFIGGHLDQVWKGCWFSTGEEGWFVPLGHFVPLQYMEPSFTVITEGYVLGCPIPAWISVICQRDSQESACSCTLAMIFCRRMQNIVSKGKRRLWWSPGRQSAGMQGSPPSDATWDCLLPQHKLWQHVWNMAHRETP